MPGNLRRTTREDVLENYALFVRAFAGDLEPYLAQIDPAVEWVPVLAALEGRIYRGHEGIRRWFDDLHAHWEWFQPVPEEVRDLGDGRFLVLGHWNAVGRSGVEVGRQPGAWIIHWRDGRIVRLTTYTNRDEGIAAAGRDG